METGQTDLVQSVHSMALEAVRAYEEHMIENALEKLQTSLRKVDDSQSYSPWENESRVDSPSAVLRKTDSGPQSAVGCEIAVDGQSVSVAPIQVDDPTLALWNISKNPMTSRNNRVHRKIDMVPVYLTRMDPVPRYDAWVPVNKEFWVGNDFVVEPYMPWFGDEEDKRGNAFELYRRMAKLAQDDTVVSDGELDDHGNFIEPPDDEEAWRIYDSVSEQRRRASCRSAITAVVQRFDRNNVEVLDALASVLNLGSRHRVVKMLEIAESRRHQAELAAKKKEDAEIEKKRVGDAWSRDIGYGDYDESPELDEAIAPLIHFCFTCHVFHCPRHLNHNVEPIIPIKDNYVEMRQNALKKAKSMDCEGGTSLAKLTGLKPCGTDCHLLSAWEAVPTNETDNLSLWSKEERLLLKEGISIFKRDPCCISEVLGKTKSCRQVAAYLQLPDVSAMSSMLIGEATKKRWPLETNRGGRMTAERSPDADEGQRGCNESSLSHIDQRHSRNSNSQSSRSTRGRTKPATKGTLSDDSADDTDASQEADFVPCAHLGPCDKASCSCFVKNLKCEATCGCNTGRWTIRGYETPVGRTGSSDKKKVCKLRHWGCSCQPGSHCNTNNCECWEERRSCDPDFCDHCQANILPNQITSDNRGCRNVGVPIGRHKRTIIGKSAVHGFGLFAGEVFEEGDLVGIYGGQIMDTKKADSLGFLYDAKDHTFFFDVTQSLVVDGGVLGMKSKFVNHVQGGSPEENCHSRCVRVRGMAHIALFATRRVEIGEEFRFDYKFQEIVPDWAQRRTDSADEILEQNSDARDDSASSDEISPFPALVTRVGASNSEIPESQIQTEQSVSDDDEFIVERR